MSRYADRRYRYTEYRPALCDDRPSTAREIAGIVRDAIVGFAAVLTVLILLLIAAGGTT